MLGASGFSERSLENSYGAFPWLGSKPEALGVVCGVPLGILGVTCCFFLGEGRIQKLEFFSSGEGTIIFSVSIHIRVSQLAKL